MSMTKSSSHSVFAPRGHLVSALLAAVLLAAVLTTQVQGRYIPERRMLRREQRDILADPAFNDINKEQLQPHRSAPGEPSLFELLVNALSDPDAEDSLKRGVKTYKKTKPCYWSLVSCY